MTWPLRLRALCAAVFVASLLSGAAAAAAAPTTPAADPADVPEGPAVTSALHSLAPSVLTPDADELVLTGTVHNTGNETVRNVQVLPRFSRVALDSRSDIGRVPTDDTLNWGARHSDVFELTADTLAPGETRDFALRVPTELLDFGATGVYVVGIDVMASPADNDTRIRADTSRTVVPWLAADEDMPAIPVSMVWPVASRPATMPDGTLLDNSLATQIGPGEPLSTIVDTARDAPVTWVIDPDTVNTVDDMADGYRMAAPSGPVEGSQADTDAAGSWRAALRQATAGSDVVLLPYADPDVQALASEPELADTVTERAVAASSQATTALGARSTLAWLDAASVTDDSLDTLARTGAEAVLVPGHAVTPRSRQAGATLVAGDRSLDALVTDIGLSDAIADAANAADPQAGALTLRQRWFAETAMIALAADGQVPPVVAAPPLRWHPEPATAQAVIDTWTSVPWIQPITLDEAQNRSSAPQVTPDPDQGANVLPEANVAAAAELNEQAARYTGLLADAEESDRNLALATVRASSAAWRDDPAAGVAYARSITEELAANLGEVSVTVPESVTLSSRNGTFPLTVTNDLPQAVTIDLDITSTNVDRLRVDDVTEKLIEPGERALVEVTAQASANGKVPIDVQLTTGNGAAIGPARPTVVNATDYGTFGWIIVVAAGALFAAAVVRRTLRGRRPSAEDDDGDHPGEDEPGTAAGRSGDEEDGPAEPAAGQDAPPRGASIRGASR